MQPPSPYLKQLLDKQKDQRNHLIWSFWPPALGNPGKYDDLTQASRDLIGQTSESFEGVKIDISKGLADNLSVHHSFSLTNDQNANTYGFSVQGITSPSTMLMGRVHSDWTVIGKWVQILSARYLLSVTGQASREAHHSGVGVELEYSGDDWHGGFMWNNPGVYRATYSQSITNFLAMGGEMAYHHKQGMSVGSMAMRYLTKHGVVTLQAAVPSIQIGYFHQVNSNFEMACEYLVSASQGIESKVDFGYIARFKDVECKVHIDSQFHGQSTVSGRISKSPINWTLFGDFDYKKNKWGAGLSIYMQV